MIELTQQSSEKSLVQLCNRPGKWSAQIGTETWCDPRKISSGIGVRWIPAIDRMKKLEDGWDVVKKPQVSSQGAREIEFPRKAEKLHTKKSQAK